MSIEHTLPHPQLLRPSLPHSRSPQIKPSYFLNTENDGNNSACSVYDLFSTNMIRLITIKFILTYVPPHKDQPEDIKSIGKSTDH